MGGPIDSRSAMNEWARRRENELLATVSAGPEADGYDEAKAELEKIEARQASRGLRY